MVLRPFAASFEITFPTWNLIVFSDIPRNRTISLLDYRVGPAFRGLAKMTGARPSQRGAVLCRLRMGEEASGRPRRAKLNPCALLSEFFCRYFCLPPRLRRCLPHRHARGEKTFGTWQRRCKALTRTCITPFQRKPSRTWFGSSTPKSRH